MRRRCSGCARGSAATSSTCSASWPLSPPRPAGTTFGWRRPHSLSGVAAGWRRRCRGGCNRDAAARPPGRCRPPGSGWTCRRWSGSSGGWTSSTAPTSCCRRPAVVLTPSEAVAEEVRAEYPTLVAPDRVVATPLGADAAWFTAAPPDPGWLAARGLPERYLLFVGTVEPRKGLPTLLGALRLLHRDPGYEPPPLVLAGPPGWGPALETAGLPDGAVRSAGYLEPAELRRVVAGAAALAFPSVYEGFGLPPLEAFAAGRPVVGSDLPVIREVTGGMASLVPVGDETALATALQAVFIDDGGPAAAAARRERARAFSWTATAAGTYAAYLRAHGR